MSDEPVVKKTKVEDQPDTIVDTVYEKQLTEGRVRGVASIKPEYLVARASADARDAPPSANDDLAEGGEKPEETKKKGGGQNKNRSLKQKKDTIKMCSSAMQVNEDGSTPECSYGAKCKFEHDLSKYLDSKPADLEGVCPVFEGTGQCPQGYKCRWLSSHRNSEGKLVVDEEKKKKASETNKELNHVFKHLNPLQRKKYDLSKSDEAIKFIDAQIVRDEDDEQTKLEKKETIEIDTGRIRPSEKKKLDLKGKYIVSPLTTVGNLPYRRLMKDLGADVTYGEMALTLPLIQGHKAEWALTRCHSSEVTEGSHFGVQVTAPKHWQAIKAAQAVSELCTGISEINLNCGCPIDLVYRQGAGSALMDQQGKTARIVRGMSMVSGDVPITVKMRTGTGSTPTAKKLTARLLAEGQTAAFTLHGRSRAQRYTKLADWNYIREVADSVINTRDAVREKSELDDHVISHPTWVVGNGDCFTWSDWHRAVDEAHVDSVMVARGALIKPWIFEEVESRQNIDKSATERLEYFQKFAQYGLEHWGSDQYGVNQTRRYMCEFMSFTHRYVPSGILEYLPAKMNDRPDLWKGRDEMETLLGSSDYRDWIKVTERFLGPVGDEFEFTPKHKSNAYPAESG